MRKVIELKMTVTVPEGTSDEKALTAVNALINEGLSVAATVSHEQATDHCQELTVAQADLLIDSNFSRPTM